jgi:hypothetical protein
LFLAYFAYFEKNRVGLWDHVAVCVCARTYARTFSVCVSPYRW